MAGAKAVPPGLSTTTGRSGRVAAQRAENVRLLQIDADPALGLEDGREHHAVRVPHSSCTNFWPGSGNVSRIQCQSAAPRRWALNSSPTSRETAPIRSPQPGIEHEPHPLREITGVRGIHHEAVLTVAHERVRGARVTAHQHGQTEARGLVHHRGVGILARGQDKNVRGAERLAQRSAAEKAAPLGLVIQSGGRAPDRAPSLRHRRR